MKRLWSVFVVAAAMLVLLAAKLPWQSKSPETWTAEEAGRVLDASPWAQAAEATFPDPRDHDAIPAQNLPGPAQAGMAGPRGVSDGRWDGGVASNHGAGLPSLQVLVRWESASVVLLARSRLSTLDGKATGQPIALPGSSSDYVISLTGLVPGNARRKAAQLGGTSSSEDGVSAGAPADTENLLENFMGNSTLESRSGASERPNNARLDASSGTVILFFSRTLNLQNKDKEAYLVTRYGSLVVKKRFRLGEMLYKGRLEL